MNVRNLLRRRSVEAENGRAPFGLESLLVVLRRNYVSAGKVDAHLIETHIFACL